MISRSFKPIFVLIAWAGTSRTSFVVALAMLASIAAADEVPRSETKDALKRDADEPAKETKRQQFLKDAKDFCQSTKMSFAVENESAKDDSAIELVPEPVMRYSDEPRFIPNAAMWIWLKNARPVAIQKVEVNNFNKLPLWTICWASLSEELITARWSDSSSFETTTPGWNFKPVSNVAAPAAKETARNLQLRAIARRFSGQVVSFLNGDRVELRLMPRPIFEYSDPDTKLPVGAIFGLASNGTNPTLLVAVEARQSGDGQLRWVHAHSRLTSEAGHLKLDDTTIWEFEAKPPPPKDLDNWTYFFVPHE